MGMRVVRPPLETSTAHGHDRVTIPRPHPRAMDRATGMTVIDPTSTAGAFDSLESDHC